MASGLCPLRQKIAASNFRDDKSASYYALYGWQEVFHPKGVNTGQSNIDIGTMLQYISAKLHEILSL